MSFFQLWNGFTEYSAEKFYIRCFFPIFFYFGFRQIIFSSHVTDKYVIAYIYLLTFAQCSRLLTFIDAANITLNSQSFSFFFFPRAHNEVRIANLLTSNMPLMLILITASIFSIWPLQQFFNYQIVQLAIHEQNDLVCRLQCGMKRWIFLLFLLFWGNQFSASS